ncbi:MAG: coenzyme F420-0:L-glutamate ligase [Haloarculaceae archaeon]
MVRGCIRRPPAPRHGSVERCPFGLCAATKKSLFHNGDFRETPFGTVHGETRLESKVESGRGTRGPLRSHFLRPGTMDLATGCSGIQAIDSNFGRTALYGQPKIGGMDLVADELAAASALLFGQADERTPVVVVRGLDYEDGEGIPNSGGLVRRGLRKTIRLTGS